MDERDRQQTMTVDRNVDGEVASPQERGMKETKRLLRDLFGPSSSRDFAIRLWDGTVEAPPDPVSFTLVLRHPGALRRMLLPPTERTLGEAFMRGDCDIEGDVVAATGLAERIAGRFRSPRTALPLILRIRALPDGSGPPAHFPPLEAPRSSDGSGASGPDGSGFRERPGLHEAPGSRDRSGSPDGFGRDDGSDRRGHRGEGQRHSTDRDLSAVRYHYDLGNDFYRLWLDRRMVYSCGYFEDGIDSLDDAQEAKLDLVCRKLRLQEGERLLDIGCGWGALVIHAAERYGVRAAGITLSPAQATLARERIRSAGLEERCQVEVLDYRRLPENVRFDKIASIGMVEHVGRKMLSTYFGEAFRLLESGGLFLNHGIVHLDPDSSPLVRFAKRRLRSRVSFIDRYVFPDSELMTPARVFDASEGAGFEMRDVESLREHYARTTRHWVDRLEAHWDEAVALVGEPTARVWKLYMGGSSHLFRTGSLGVIQALLARRDAEGEVRIPATRADIYANGSGAPPAPRPQRTGGVTADHRPPEEVPDAPLEPPVGVIQRSNQSRR